MTTIVRTACALALGLLVALGFTRDASAQDLRQVKLTEAHVKNFIAAQKELNEFMDKAGDKENDKLDAEYEAIAKKHGFASFAELDDVASNISLIYSGLDPQSGAYTDPAETIRKEMAEIKADKEIPAADKKQMLEELEEAIKSTPKLQFPENIELVKGLRKELESVMQ
jgi:hypothetical protein